MSTSTDAPYLNIYLQTERHVNANTRTIEIDGDLTANISTMSMDEQSKPEVNSSSSKDSKLELIANASTDATNNASSANISSSSTVAAYEGHDVTLAFVIESYPPIRNHSWITPTIVNDNTSSITVHEESYTTTGCRLACYVLTWYKLYISMLPW